MALGGLQAPGPVLGREQTLCQFTCTCPDLFVLTLVPAKEAFEQLGSSDL